MINSRAWINKNIFQLHTYVTSLHSAVKSVYLWLGNTGDTTGLLFSTTVFLPCILQIGSWLCTHHLRGGNSLCPQKVTCWKFNL